MHIRVPSFWNNQNYNQKSRRVFKRACVSIVFGAFALVMLLALFQVIELSKSASADPTITEFPTTTASSYPTSIVTGPDGALWFTEYVQSKIGRISTSGTITEYSVPSSGPYGITVGPDGALWFTETLADKIGRISTSGTVTQFTLPAVTPGQGPNYITTGSDGALWFTNSNNSIGKITTSGTVTEYPLPATGSSPGGIVAGPNGALWFTEYGNNSIGQITTAGVLTEYKISASTSYSPDGITVGPDGALWFTELTAGIGRITTSGVISQYATPGANPYGSITTGPDGALWFTEALNNSIGRITTTGNVTAYTVPTANSYPTGISSGSDGALWFTEQQGFKIGRITTNVTQVVPTNLTAASPTANLPVLTWTASSGANSYNVYRNGTVIGSSSTPTYTDSGPSQGTNSYDVTAVYSGIETAASNTVSVVYDTAPPTITYSLSPAPNSAGWNNSSVTISYSCSDAIVGILSCPASGGMATGQGAGQTVTATAENNVGLKASVTATINIDKTAPTITATVTPAPNGSGWNNSPVTVSYTCSDALSGVASCPSPVTISNDANEQIAGTATDIAGNTGSVTKTIKLDQTPPNVGTPFWSANPVVTDTSSTLTVPATDSMSGVIGGEYYLGNTDPGQGHGTAMSWNGTNLTANIGSSLLPGTYTVNVRSEDAAGNWSSVTTSTLTVRPTAPTGLAIPSPTQEPVLTWSTDASAISYNVYRNGALLTSSATNSYSDTTAPEGTDSYDVTAVNAGNESGPSNAVSVEVDQTPPTITYSLSPTPNSAGWNNSQVTVTFSCSDGGSGVFSCPSPQTLISEGANQQVTGTASDKAGNSASVTAAVNIDETAPTITASVTPAPNGGGWNNSPVIVSYICSDALSGIASCPSPVTISSDTASQSLTGTADDNAGNSASITTTVKLDQTPPTLGTPVWSASTVITGTDSSLSVPASDVLSGVVGGEYYLGATDPGQGNGTAMSWDGTNLTTKLGSSLVPGTYTVNVRSEDAAGNWRSVMSTTLTVNPAAPANLAIPGPTQYPALSWDADAGATSYNIYRNGTMIDSSSTNSYNDTSAPEGSSSYYVTAVNGGSESSPSNTVSVLVDRTPPSITYTLSTSPNKAGWNNGQVTVNFICGDSGSGIFSCPSSQTLISEGLDQTVTGTATDNAGNSASITATVSIDQTPPVVGLPTWDNNPITTATSANLSVPVTDALSGVSSGEYYLGTSDPGEGSGIPMTWDGTKLTAIFGSLAAGTYQINVRAEDNAGNWSSVVTTNLVVNNPIPAGPTGLSAPTPTNQAPALIWNASTNATSYNIYRNGSKIDTSTTPAYTDGSAPQGTNSYYVTAVNSGGESGPSNTVNVTYDTVPPSISYTLSPTPNANGWENSPVTVSFSCSDALSGLTSCTSPVVLTTDGAGQTVTGSATDDAGNAASVTATVNLDQTLPTAGTPAWSANPITVGHAATLSVPVTDGLSGVVGGEYFVGTTDPGDGNGTPMTLSGGNLTASIGSALTVGTYQISIRAVDADGNWSTLATTNLVVSPATIAPTITSSNTVTTSAGTPFSFTVTTTGVPSPALSEAGSLPHNLTFTDNGNGTATMAGTAASGTNGSYPITITATNSAGKAIQTFTLVVTTTNSAPKITSANALTVAYGVTMAPFSITTTGFPTPSITATTLPSGLAFKDNGNGTASITGMPSKNAYGVFTVTITAKNSVSSVTQTLTITVTRPPQFTPLSILRLIAVVGKVYSVSITSTGYPIPSMTESGTLPNGLKFTNNTNGTVTISGTPASGSAGTYTVKVTATNSLGSTSVSFTLLVAQVPAITSSNAATANVGKALKFQVTASGFPTPFYLITGQLPKGLEFNGLTGVLSGTPKAGTAGTYPLTIVAFNIAGSVSQKFTITVK